MADKKPIIIGSRGSDLALWQANYVKDRLTEMGENAEIKIIKTQGDKIQHLSFDKMEGKGFFTKEIEAELLDGSIDLAVHSHKDLETTNPEGLTIAAVSSRANPADLLLINPDAVKDKRKFEMKQEPVVGTSSARRKAQLLFFRPDVKIKDLRGNVPTRIQKLKDGQYDAILVAKAGVDRLGLDLSDLHVVEMNPAEFVPAPAQGVLGLQVRNTDDRLVEVLKKINDDEVEQRINLEREVLRLMEGGCQMPLGVYCVKEENEYFVYSALADAWNAPLRRDYVESKTLDGVAEGIAKRLQLKERKKSVFISRALPPDSIIKHFLANMNVDLMDSTLIQSEAVSFSYDMDPDWIFFSSRNAVHYFFGQHKPSGKSKMAALGKGTADELSKYVTVDFAGSGTDTKSIAESFKEKVGNGTVMFPQSKQSLRSIQSVFPDDQVENVVCYHTLADPKPVHADVLFFTSPSNTSAYLMMNEIESHQLVVGMGASTSNFMKERGHTVVATPRDYSDLAILDAILYALSLDEPVSEDA